MNKKISYFTALSFLFAMAGIAFADTNPVTDIPAQPAINSLPTYLKWVFDAGITLGFISVIIAIVVAATYYILSPVSTDMRGKAKDWLSGAISGLLIFVLLYLIITTINPALAFFKFGNSQTTPTLTGGTQKKAGVYLYQSSDCTGEAVTTTSSNPVFDNPGKFNSIEVASNQNTNEEYVALLYDKESYTGSCQYETTGCFTIGLTNINSLVVKKVNYSGGGDVTFYRNPSFTKDGGYLAVQANPFFDEDLKGLNYTGTPGDTQCNVPDAEQKCTKYDVNGKCVQKTCPNLVNNIDSIKLDGNYIVVLSYHGPKDKDVESFCQTYPTTDDINDTGPKQINWDAIENRVNLPLIYFPNHVKIISVE